MGDPDTVYENVKPNPDDRVRLMLTPRERLDRLAALIPPPYRHWPRTFGVLAPNALRAAAKSSPSSLGIGGTRDHRVPGGANVHEVYGACPGPAAGGKGRCWAKRERPTRLADVRRQIRSAHQPAMVAKGRLNQACRGPLAPSSSSDSGMVFTLHVGMLSPNHD